MGGCWSHPKHNTQKLSLPLPLTPNGRSPFTTSVKRTETDPTAVEEPTPRGDACGDPEKSRAHMCTHVQNGCLHLYLTHTPDEFIFNHKKLFGGVSVSKQEDVINKWGDIKNSIY